MATTLKRFPRLKRATLPAGTGLGITSDDPDAARLLGGEDISHTLPGGTRSATYYSSRSEATRRTVLLIDGSPEVHTFVQTQLRDLNADVYHAYSASEGLLQLSAWSPDLLLVDCRLPDLDRFEMLRHVSTETGLRPLPAIFLTAPEDEVMQFSNFERGAADYLPKPFSGGELRARVRSALQTQSLLARLEHQATHDRLTGMLNREGLLPRIDKALSRTKARPETSFALLFLDFDNFKILNDAYGHDVGDHLLRQAALRLRDATDPQDLIPGDSPELPIARLGGDEFVVLLEDLSEPEDAEQLAKRLILALGCDYSIEGLRVTSSTSIGIVHGAPTYTGAVELLRDADAAMYEAKAAGRACYAIFDASLRRRIEKRAQIERELRLAVEASQLTLAYQPIIGLDSGRLVGLESLLRWQHPDLGNIPPAEFIPVAVDSGLIGPLGDWVLKKACSDFRQLQEQMGTNAPDFIAVNVSRKQLTDAHLPAKISAVLTESGIDPQCLHLEITESELMTNLVAAKDTLRKIKRLGVALSVDDFGTGYSSLASLYDFPIDVFKLDRSFIAADLTSERGRALMAVTHAVLQLARNIGVRVIAEGIETAQQLAVLQSLRCDMAQGYLIGRPMPLEKLQDWSRTPVAAAKFDDQ